MAGTKKVKKYMVQIDIRGEIYSQKTQRSVVPYFSKPVIQFNTPLRGVLFNTRSESIVYLRGTLYSARLTGIKNKKAICLKVLFLVYFPCTG